MRRCEEGRDQQTRRCRENERRFDDPEQPTHAISLCTRRAALRDGGLMAMVRLIAAARFRAIMWGWDLVSRRWAARRRAGPSPPRTRGTSRQRGRVQHEGRGRMDRPIIARRSLVGRRRCA